MASYDANRVVLMVAPGIESLLDYQEEAYIYAHDMRLDASDAVKHIGLAYIPSEHHIIFTSDWVMPSYPAGVYSESDLQDLPEQVEVSIGDYYTKQLALLLENLKQNMGWKLTRITVVYCQNSSHRAFDYDLTKPERGGQCISMGRMYSNWAVSQVVRVTESLIRDANIVQSGIIDYFEANKKKIFWSHQELMVSYASQRQEEFMKNLVNLRNVCLMIVSEQNDLLRMFRAFYHKSYGWRMKQLQLVPSINKCRDGQLLPAALAARFCPDDLLVSESLRQEFAVYMKSRGRLVQKAFECKLRSIVAKFHELSCGQRSMKPLCDHFRVDSSYFPIPFNSSHVLGKSSNNPLEVAELVFGPLKEVERLVAKVIEGIKEGKKPGRCVLDIIRASIICNDPSAIHFLVLVLQNDPDWQCVLLKNRYSDDNSQEIPNLHAVFQYTKEGANGNDFSPILKGFCVEIQFHLRKYYNVLKDQHRVYEIIRRTEDESLVGSHMLAEYLYSPVVENLMIEMERNTATDATLLEEKEHNLHNTSYRGPYQNLRLTITKIRDSANSNVLQLSSIQFHSKSNDVIKPMFVKIVDGHSLEGFGCENLLKADTKLKFVDEHFQINGSKSVLFFRMESTSKLGDLHGYSFVTADDQPKSDPISWKIEASDDLINWSIFDEQKDAKVPLERGAKISFDRMTAPLYINCGAFYDYFWEGVRWKADCNFTGGDYASGIHVDDPVLGSYRHWPAEVSVDSTPQYNISLPGGKYQVTLYFCESGVHDSGCRVFDVYIQSQRLLDSALDLVKMYGFQEPVFFTREVEIHNGMLKIELFGIKGIPILNGIKVIDSDGSSTTEVSTKNDVLWELPMHINCGSWSQIEYNGANWAYDRYFKGGEIIPVPGVYHPLMSSCRFWPSDVHSIPRYVIGLPNGYYRVTLYFCDGFSPNPGERVFKVFIQDEPLLETPLDLAKMHGFQAFAEYSKEVEVKNQLLFIRFERVADNPLLNGIMIEKVPDTI